MTGVSTSSGFWPSPAGIMASTLICVLAGLAACTDMQEGGEAPGPEKALGRAIAPDSQDVERPDVFEMTERGLWDGRPTLGGIWVAHLDVDQPERALIRNTVNGRSTTGALFRRGYDLPGPALQISSDAAQALGILAGEPVELDVVALRSADETRAGETAADATSAPRREEEEGEEPSAVNGAAEPALETTDTASPSTP